MMKSKPFLRNSANPALLFNLIISVSIPLFLYGCLGQIEPTYKERDIPNLVKKICKEEYSLEVTTLRTYNTLWIYAAMDKLLHQDYGIKQDKIFDEAMMDKLRNILTTTGRVLISSDNTPEFFALVASDIALGLDYMLIGNVLDIKKSYAGFIPWTEANRRYVIRFKIAPEAIGDSEGKHLSSYDIKLPDFLAEQIVQRISAQFQQEELKKYFKVTELEGSFTNDNFVFEYVIEPISKPGKEMDVREEILNTITYCIKTYEFRDFAGVEIKDSTSGNNLILGKVTVWARPTE